MWTDKEIYCLPYVGEFGWELFAWQAYLRKLSFYNSIIVSCKKENRYLYSDFAKRIYPVSYQSIKPICWKDSGTPLDFEKVFQQAIPPGAIVLDPRQGLINWDNTLNSDKVIADFTYQSFFKYGVSFLREIDLNYDLILHCRRETKCSYRNYQHWPRLASLIEKMGLRVATIGTGQDSYHLGEDFRGIELETLCNVLRASRLILGGSSGPMHLAALCGCPIAVWFADRIERNRKRYLTDWNPFSVPVSILSESWQPAPDVIAKKLERILCPVTQ